MGTIVRENERTEVFDNKHKMWQAIKEMAEKEEKRGHNLFCYAHNCEFDFYAIGDLKDREMQYISFRPFIARRRNLWLLDTVAITRAPLSEVAEWIGMKKGETPEELKTGNLTWQEFHDNFELKARTSEYCKNDALITLRLVKAIKKKLSGEEIRIKRLISAGQIGMSVFLRQIKQMEIANKWMDPTTGGFIEQGNIEDSLARRASHGARVEACQLGKFEKIWYFDLNSLYPHILSTMKLPDLRAGAEAGGEELLDTDKTGCARAIMHKPDGMNGIGVRSEEELAFPEQEAIMAGTYTLEELREFRKEGCKMIEVEGFGYPSLDNPLREFIEEKYELRKESAFSKAFWKLVLNNIVGKFGQHRESKEIRFEDMGLDREMKDKGFELKDVTEDLGMYVKNNGEYRSRSYCPILYAHVTAGARMMLWKQSKLVKEQDLLYMDTDSILMTNGASYEKLFDMGTNLGQWKIEAKDEPARIWGKKTYSVGKLVKMSGAPKSQLTPEIGEKRGGLGVATPAPPPLLSRVSTPPRQEEFKWIMKMSGAPKNQITPEMIETGEVSYAKMAGMRQNADLAGTFVKESHFLTDTTEREVKRKERIRNTTVFIDTFEPKTTELLDKVKQATKEHLP